MEGEEFEKLELNLTPSEFYEKVKHLKILSRSRPEHKLRLVEGLKRLNNVVAVTGDGTNDAPALLKANVGVAMGISGTQVAKNAADILILDDNFNSIVRSIVWGRNIYESIKKFLQFQLTVNMVACVFSIISSSIFRQSVFTTVQMLWVNMIMDSLASLALSTDPPNTDKMLHQRPVNRSDSLITRTMIKHITIQSIYQIGLLLFLVINGQYFLPEYPDQYDQLIGTDLGAKYYLGQAEGTMVNGLFHPLSGESFEPYFDKYHIYSRHLTFVFNVFVFLQIFNFFSCRKINDELDIFSGLLTNYIFWFIFIFITVFQWSIIYFLN
jgi:P-type Ca2+ transporter type 2B